MENTLGFEILVHYRIIRLDLKHGCYKKILDLIDLR